MGQIVHLPCWQRQVGQHIGTGSRGKRFIFGVRLSSGRAALRLPTADLQHHYAHANIGLSFTAIRLSPEGVVKDSPAPVQAAVEPYSA